MTRRGSRWLPNGTGGGTRRLPSRSLGEGWSCPKYLGADSADALQGIWALKVGRWALDVYLSVGIFADEEG
jgi:hypothetical protein